MTAKMVKGPGSAKVEGRDARELDQPIHRKASSASSSEQTVLFVKSEINLIGGQENG